MSRVTIISIQTLFSVTMVRSLNDTRCVGLFTTKDEAVLALKKNDGDVSDGGHYKLAVIEVVPVNMIYPAHLYQSWYKFDPAAGKYGEYKPARRPKAFRNTVAIGIG